jgi:MFS transporter, DHA1 family, multidrug resistance protein
MVVICRWRLPEGHPPDPGVSLRLCAHLPQFRGGFAGATIPDLCAGGRFFVLRPAGLCRRFPGHFHGSVPCERTHVWRHFCGVIRWFHWEQSDQCSIAAQIFQRADFSRRLVGGMSGGLAVFGGDDLRLVRVGAHAGVAVHFLSSLGLAFPNAAALALAPFDHNIGSASAMLGFLQIGVSSIASASIGCLIPTVCCRWFSFWPQPHG